MEEIPFVVSLGARKIIKDLVGLDPISRENGFDQYIFPVKKSKDMDDLQALFELVKENGMVVKSLRSLDQISWLIQMDVIN